MFESGDASQHGVEAAKAFRMFCDCMRTALASALALSRAVEHTFDLLNSPRDNMYVLMVGSVLRIRILEGNVTDLSLLDGDRSVDSEAPV